MKKEHIEKQDLGWIEWESSSELFSLAKKRIYKPNGDLELEIPPKWEVFSTLIEEIRHCKQRGTRANRSILINCKNYASAKLGFQFDFVLFPRSGIAFFKGTTDSRKSLALGQNPKTRQI